MEFYKDLAKMVSVELDAESISYQRSLIDSDHKELLRKYFEYKLRRINKTSRKVYYSAELLSSSELAENKTAVDSLENLAVSRGEFAPFQTRQLYNLDFNDALFNDWNIQHLHLGVHSPGNTFCDGTKDLLYTYFTESEVYFISIMDHRSFSELKLLEIIDNNWPVIIDSHVLHGVLDVQYQYNSEDIHQLRRGGVNSILKLSSGKIIFSPGGGYSTARTSQKSMNTLMYYSSLVGGAEKYVKDNIENILAKFSIDSTADIELTSISNEGFTIKSKKNSEKISVDFSNPA